MACQTKVARKRRKFRHQRQMPRRLFIDREESPKAGIRNTGPSSGSSGTTVQARTPKAAFCSSLTVATPPCQEGKKRNHQTLQTIAAVMPAFGTKPKSALTP
jgi:hypothetical protein